MVTDFSMNLGFTFYRDFTEKLNLLESSLTRGKLNLRNHRITSWFDYHSKASNLNLRFPLILKQLLPKKDL